MPVIPIPDDWNGQDWLCVQVEWPLSIKWLALLAGLLTTPLRGRFWDERTGNIRAAQAIGAQIDKRNLPFNACAGEIPPDIITVIEKVFIGQEFDQESEDLAMSLCGYNPDAFKIEDGQLWVRNFCGEWEAIGSISGVTPDLPPDVPDPPPGSLTDATACSMAYKLAQFVLAILVQAWIEIGTPEIVDVYDFVSDMRDYFPGVDLAYNDLINLYFNLIPLDVAGLQNESIDPELAQWVACYMVSEITASNTGITSSEYDACKSATSAAIRAAVGDSAWLGFGAQIRKIWEYAIKSIGAKDAQKITYFAQPTGLEDCECPGVSQGQIGPTASGWYFGAEHTIQVACPGGFDYGYMYVLTQLPHDAYGLTFTVEKVSGDNLNRLKRSNDAVPASGWDHFYSHTNSESLSLDTQYLQVGDAAYLELNEIFPGTKIQGDNSDYSDDVETPVSAKLQNALMTVAGQADGDPAEITLLMRLRWLHNSENP